MPRVRPSEPRFAADETVRAWQAFAFDGADGVGHTIMRGVRLRGDHVAVRTCSWNFVADAEVDDAEPPAYPSLPEEPKAMFSGPTRIRFVPHWTPNSVVQVGSQQYSVGQEVVVPAATAEHLVSEGYAVRA